MSDTAPVAKPVALSRRTLEIAITCPDMPDSGSVVCGDVCGTGVNRWLHLLEVEKPYAVLSRGARGVSTVGYTATKLSRAGATDFRVSTNRTGVRRPYTHTGEYLLAAVGPPRARRQKRSVNSLSPAALEFPQTRPAAILSPYRHRNRLVEQSAIEVAQCGDASLPNTGRKWNCDRIRAHPYNPENPRRSRKR